MTKKALLLIVLLLVLSIQVSAQEANSWYCDDEITSDADECMVDNCIGNCVPDGVCIFDTDYGGCLDQHGTGSGRCIDQTTGQICPTLDQCSDTLDNDEDGLTDFPADPDCTSATDDSEGSGGGGGGSCNYPQDGASSSCNGDTNRNRCTGAGFDWNSQVGSSDSCCGDDGNSDYNIYKVNENTAFVCDNDAWTQIDAMDCNNAILARPSLNSGNPLDPSALPASLCRGEVLRPPFYGSNREFLAAGSNWRESTGSCGSTTITDGAGASHIYIDSSSGWIECSPTSFLNKLSPVEFTGGQNIASGTGAIQCGTHTYYCGSDSTTGTPDWTQNLDPAQYQLTCGQQGFTWTGNYCCSEDEDREGTLSETYYDHGPIGACYKGKFQPNDYFLTKVPEPYVIIEDGKYLGCALDSGGNRLRNQDGSDNPIKYKDAKPGPGEDKLMVMCGAKINQHKITKLKNWPDPANSGPKAEPLVEIEDFCTIQNAIADSGWFPEASGDTEFFCSYSQNWIPTNGETKTHLKSVPLIRQLTCDRVDITKELRKECCAIDECWTGSDCVAAGAPDGKIHTKRGEPQPGVVPYLEFGPPAGGGGGGDGGGDPGDGGGTPSGNCIYFASNGGDHCDEDIDRGTAVAIQTLQGGTSVTFEVITGTGGTWFITPHNVMAANPPSGGWVNPLNPDGYPRCQAYGNFGNTPPFPITRSWQDSESGWSGSIPASSGGVYTLGVYGGSGDGNEAKLCISGAAPALGGGAITEPDFSKVTGMAIRDPGDGGGTGTSDPGNMADIGLYYCVYTDTNSSYADWENNLDPLERQQDCTDFGYTWTGNWCCSEGDEGFEYYNDPLGGTGACFNKIFQPNGQFLMPDGENPVSWVIISNSSHWGCHLQGDDVSGYNNLNNDHLIEDTLETKDWPDPGGTWHTQDRSQLLPLVENKEYCSRAYDSSGTEYYCSFTEEWLAVNNSERAELKRVAWPVQDLSTAAQCCGVTSCWNGTSCVDDQADDPSSQPNFADFRCENGTWTDSFLKTSRDKTEKGYCTAQTFCLDSLSTGCVNSNIWLGEDYCYIGEWTSRTRLVADKLLGIAGGNDFSLYCDDKSNSLIVTSNTGSTSKYCSLNYDGKVVLGTSIGNAMEDNPIDEFMRQLEIAYNNAYNNTDDFEDFEHTCTEETGGDGNFGHCVDLNLLHVYYDGERKLVLISSEESAVTGNIVGRIIDFFRRVLGIQPPLPHLSDFERIYIERNGGEEVSAVLEKVYDEDNQEFNDYITVEYKNLDIDSTTLLESLNAEEETVDTSNEDTIIIILKEPDNDVWDLVSGRTRLQ